MISSPCYSVLVVSSAPKFQESLNQFLPASVFQPVCAVSGVGAARRELLNRSFDLIIINSPLPDEYGTKLAIDASQTPGCVVLQLVRAESYEELTAKISPMGVFTLPKPISISQLEHALSWMVTARQRLRMLEKKTSTVEERMEEIRMVNRAKWLLIEQLKMTEPEAHRYIEKQAMDRCTTRKDIAQTIIKTYA